MSTDRVPVFDGHNDLLLRLYGLSPPERESAALQGRADGHLDLPRMRAGGFAGGLFAIYVPSVGDGLDGDALMERERYALPLAPAVPFDAASAATVSMASILLRLERASDGALTICRSAAEIRAAMARGAIAAVLHVEGAEGIDPDLDMLEVLHAAGLRSLGPVWSRPNRFGHGVPFRFPSSPDTGKGLTDHGRALIKACNRLKIMIDLSHLNEKGFWEVAQMSDAPLVASHSNAHALCPSSRNLTDRQLAAIGESRGLVGVNYATSFLRADGRKDARTGLDEITRHIDYLLERLGEDGVALGSDFDGAQIPDAIGDAAGLPNLIAALRARGYGEALVRKIASENWISLLERTWA